MKFYQNYVTKISIMSMPKKSEDKKFYLVVSKDRGYNYGAFPFTPDGRKMAEELVKKKKLDGEELEIKEK